MMGKGEGHRAVAESTRRTVYLMLAVLRTRMHDRICRMLDSLQGEACVVDLSPVAGARPCELGMLKRVEIVLSVAASPRMSVADRPQQAKGILP